MLVHQLVDLGAKEDIALYGNGTDPITYGNMRQHVIEYRRFLSRLGVGKGDRVGLWARNCPEYIYSYMAIVSLGGIAVPINFQLTPREVAFIVANAEVSVLLTMEYLDLSEELRQRNYSIDVTQVLIKEINGEWDRDETDTAVEVSADDPCAIIYTSGTTGSPKGAVLTHGNLVSNAEAFRKSLPVYSDDNILCVLPMYHCFAWTCAVLNPLLCGASITILDGFLPKETVQAVRDHGVTGIYGVPPMYNIMARSGTAEDLMGVRFFVSGGASLPEKVAEEFRKKYGQVIMEGYGLSEASPVVTLNPGSKVKIGSIGKALPGLQVRIINHKGESLRPGEVGELAVEGPSVMQGYLNLPLETGQTIRDGWLHTGDMAYEDTEGYFFIVDRLKDMIICNGENVYPREIEELIYQFPGVVETAVIGVADELRGQAVRAYIVMGEEELDKKSLKEYLQRRLAPYKMPRDFIVVDRLPKNQTGKVLKRVLRDQLATDLSEDIAG